jgi:hypothetical protein
MSSIPLDDTRSAQQALHQALRCSFGHRLWIEYPKHQPTWQMLVRLEAIFWEQIGAKGFDFSLS